MLLALQRLLATALRLSLRRGVRLGFDEVAALIQPLIDSQPEHSEALAAQLVDRHPGQALRALRALLHDSAEPTSSAGDIDAIVNFSAHWRDAWVARKAASFPAGTRVLDAGAGEGRYRSLFAHTEYRSQDFAQYAGTEHGPLQEAWNYDQIDHVCDITAIPVADGDFDVVLCTEVLEHVPDPIAALRELGRVLRPGGTLLLTAPLGSGLHQEPYHFYGGFSPYFYRKHLGEMKFELTEVTPLGGLMRHVAQEVHRAGRVLGDGAGPLGLTESFVIMDWLPRYLACQDDAYFVEQFTVGYMVEARKLPATRATEE